MELQGLLAEAERTQAPRLDAMEAQAPSPRATRRSDRHTNREQRLPVEVQQEQSNSDDGQVHSDDGHIDPDDGYGLEVDDTASPNAATEEPDASASSDGSTTQPNTAAAEAFWAFQKRHRQNRSILSDDMKASIRLMDVLRRKRSTLDSYDEIMEWHLKETGKIRRDGKLGDYSRYISRHKLFKNLHKRYHGPPNLFETKNLTLPVSKTEIELVYHKAEDLVVSLLTDPRFTDDDWLHYNDDPTAPLPEEFDHLADINTGLGYRETHKKLIQDPTKQMLVPIIHYIDAAVSGQFGKMPVEALKMTLGILKNKTRDKRHAWRVLGYVPNYHKTKTRGVDIVRESGHVAGEAFYKPPKEDNDDEIDWDNAPGLADEAAEESEDDASDGETGMFDVDKEDFDEDEDAHEGQDWHYILMHLLQTYRQMENDGMLWPYRHKDKIHDMELVFYLAYIKCDGDEADKICGKYTTRTGNVKTLCRFCTCPTMQSSWVYGDKNAEQKTEDWIKGLVDMAFGDDEEEASAAKIALKDISQRLLRNAYHKLRFALHNDAGVHGACPSEMLHMILLGIFKYIILGLKENIGRTSKAIDEVNALARTIGKYFKHQSDRDMPLTMFYKGIFQGKIMGKEYTGVMLVALVVLLSSQGQAHLKKHQAFKGAHLQDWIMMLETLLHWEAFMKLDAMPMALVHRLEKKHRYLLYLMKKVLNRTVGMGMNCMKFHAILHLYPSMMADGVPNVVDSGSNEMHHKETKYHSKLTQKVEEKFEKQTAQREDEFALLDLALCEVDEHAVQWDYLDLSVHRGPSSVLLQQRKEQELSEQGQGEPTPVKTSLTGGTIQVYEDEDGEPAWGLATLPKKQVYWDDDAVDFLYELQRAVRGQGYSGWLSIRTDHVRDGVIFRGHPSYRGEGLWNDWVIVDWGRKHGKTPAEIWCYVDLSKVQDDFKLKFRNNYLQKGVYALVEASTYTTMPLNCETFRAINKEVAHDEQGSVVRQFWLADVNAFVEPVAVVPNIGHPSKRQYFAMVPRKKWSDLFIKWLKEPHTKELEELDEVEGKKEYKNPPPPLKKRKRRAKAKEPEAEAKQAAAK